MNRYLSGLILLSALLMPSTAHADIGFPMIIVWYPVMVFALVPIIGVETLVLYASIDISIWEAIKIMTITNLLTTLIGTPIAWLLSGALTPKWISVFHYAGDPPTPSWYKEGKFPWQAYVGHLYAIVIFSSDHGMRNIL